MKVLSNLTRQCIHVKFSKVSQGWIVSFILRIFENVLLHFFLFEVVNTGEDVCSFSFVAEEESISNIVNDNSMFHQYGYVYSIQDYRHSPMVIPIKCSSFNFVRIYTRFIDRWVLFWKIFYLRLCEIHFEKPNKSKDFTLFIRTSLYNSTWVIPFKTDIRI